MTQPKTKTSKLIGEINSLMWRNDISEFELRRVEKEIDEFRSRSMPEWHLLQGIYASGVLHDAERARKHHEVAIHGASDAVRYIMALQNYAVSMFNMRLYREAMVMARQLYEAVPDDPAALEIYIEAAARSYHLQLANSLLDEWSKRKPGEMHKDAAWISKAARLSRERGLTDERTAVLHDSLAPLFEKRKIFAETRYRILQDDTVSWLDVHYNILGSVEEAVTLNVDVAERVAASVDPDVMSFIVVHFSPADEARHADTAA